MSWNQSYTGKPADPELPHSQPVSNFRPQMLSKPDEACMRLLISALVFVLFVLPPAQAQTPTRAAKKSPAKYSKSMQSPRLTPLTAREQAQQVLNRFTFGARPGDVERVLAQTPQQWFEQQLNPTSIKDDILDKRLASYPTLTMSPEQALHTFPDRAVIKAVADGKFPMPSDPALASVYEVQIFKLKNNIEKKQDASNAVPALPNEAEMAEQKRQDQETALRIAGELFSLPRNRRMAALLQHPVQERIAFTTYVAGEQKNILLSEFSPKERETFYAMAANINSSYQIASELSQAKVLRTILSERQLQEVMTDFWFNHFNVYIGKDSDQWYTTSYERDVIRRNALGKFRDLLIATATSPAMMVYLDNWQSIGPNSLANGVNPANPKSKKGSRGLNENYGREVMELHTVGVNGGYSQADVTALAAILTGWTVDRPNQAGPFFFDPRRHEPGTKTWLGQQISSPATNGSPETPAGMQEGIQALTVLAASPQTAHFISFKLAQRFLADDPPSSVVDRMKDAYLSSDGDIKAVLRTLVQSPEFNSRQYFRNKVKTPTEFIASAFRSTATDPNNPGTLVQTLKTMGMAPYYALPPTGYYITADQWMNSAALVDRLNFAYALTSDKFANQKFDSAHVLAYGLMTESDTSLGSKVTARNNRPHYAVTAMGANTPSTAARSGQDVALTILESSLIGDQVTSQTNQLIHQQLEQLVTPTTSPADALNLLTALVMGSPEFQRH
ncbi:MAG TPA: DUF1800 domain-containing protein [Edaphobacter sp.]